MKRKLLCFCQKEIRLNENQSSMWVFFYVILSIVLIIPTVSNGSQQFPNFQKVGLTIVYCWWQTPLILPLLTNHVSPFSHMPSMNRRHQSVTITDRPCADPPIYFDAAGLHHLTNLDAKINLQGKLTVVNWQIADHFWTDQSINCEDGLFVAAGSRLENMPFFNYLHLYIRNAKRWWCKEAGG